ncbi:dehydrogenase/reductase SDR family member 11-like [Cimex lectularius]|uniref:Farnesol dehydrogenase-like n=1 Tax=Cimex lectularius TaxID=79782 RepID=A0A8I6RFI5_CIMLE|nr:dehydrogenase/reductase SDR family member 11-like [Cimex lectularius]
MEKWVDRVALVTGGNSGIGFAITESLLDWGLIVISIDKDITNLQKLNETGKWISAKGQRLHPLMVDLCDEDQVIRAFQWAENNLNTIDLLVNNAGVGGTLSLLSGNTSEWKRLLDVNVIAFSLCAVQAVALMRKTKNQQGQIINITSNLANFVPTYAPFHFYAATKHAAKAFTEGLRQELIDIEIPIRITSISPGLVKTGILKSSLGIDMDKLVFDKHPSITPHDVAASLEYILSTPIHVTINEVAIRPTRALN